MSFGFALYGLCLAGSAAMTLRTARARDRAAHRRWGLRTIWLAIASWLFRVEYGLWFLFTGGLGSTPTLDGPFDKVMVLAFFVPPLLILEWRFRRAGAAAY